MQRIQSLSHFFQTYVQEYNFIILLEPDSCLGFFCSDQIMLSYLIYLKQKSKTTTLKPHPILIEEITVDK